MRSADSSWLVFHHCFGYHLIGLVSLLSGFDCPVRRPSPTASLSSFVQLSDWRSLPTSGHVEISGPNSLSGFAPKQTKGSSDWRTTYIVLHCISKFLRMLCIVFSLKDSGLYINSKYSIIVIILLYACFSTPFIIDGFSLELEWMKDSSGSWVMTRWKIIRKWKLSRKW